MKNDRNSIELHVTQLRQQHAVVANDLEALDQQRGKIAFEKGVDELDALELEIQRKQTRLESLQRAIDIGVTQLERIRRQEGYEKELVDFDEACERHRTLIEQSAELDDLLSMVGEQLQKMQASVVQIQPTLSNASRRALWAGIVRDALLVHVYDALRTVLGRHPMFTGRRAAKPLKAHIEGLTLIRPEPPCGSDELPASNDAINNLILEK